MPVRTTQLALEVVSDVEDAVSGLGKVEDAADQTASALDHLADMNAKAGEALDEVTSKADTLDQKGAQLTGALGALSSGFELVGAGDVADALNKAAMATDFLSGVGQAAALAVEAQAAATKALTVAQKAANIAMRANPIGLVVTAAVALVAVLVLAYNKSETFREIVQSVGRVGKAAFGLISEAAEAVRDWVADRIPAALGVIRDKAGDAVRPATTAFNGAKDAAKDVWDWVSKIPGKLGELKDKAAEIAAPILAPFTAVRDAIQAIIDKLANIKLPDWFKDLPGVPGRYSASGYSAGPTGSAPVTAPAAPPVSITVQGALDPYAVAQQIVELLRRYGTAVGTPVVTP